MDRLTRYLARKAYRVALGWWMLGLAFILNGCSYAPPSDRTPIERLNFATPAVSGIESVQRGLPDSDIYPNNNKNPAKLGLSEDQAKAIGCSMADRFDNSAALAYNFTDNQSRLALHLSLDGPSFSDPGNMEFKGFMLRYTHKFSKPPESKREKCKFPSRVQGLIGSAYNELFVRDNFTVWKELRNRLNLSK